MTIYSSAAVKRLLNKLHKTNLKLVNKQRQLYPKILFFYYVFHNKKIFMFSNGKNASKFEIGTLKLINQKIKF